MKLKDWLVPREEKFFDILEEQSAIVVEGAAAFVDMLQNYDKAIERTRTGGLDAEGGIRQYKRRVKEIEHRGDLKTHELFTALNATFITPLDREDLASLASAMDDVLDLTYATANHLHLYDVHNPGKELLEVAIILHDQTKQLRQALLQLRDPSKRDELGAKLVEIHSLENQADEITNRAKAALFKDDDVKHILKMKDIYESIETATDKCEDAADVIRDILVKHQ